MEEKSRGRSDRLKPDELAFYFTSERGVSAEALGKFLQRAATVAKRSDAKLNVVALQDGSLAVVFRPIGRTLKAGKEEFKKSPIATTGVPLSLALAVYSIFLNDMDLEHQNPTPLAKSAAELVDSGEAHSIQLISKEKTKLIMDVKTAKKIRRSMTPTRRHDTAFASEPMKAEALKELAERAIEGSLSGEILQVSGKPHFRPDGYRYLVPVEAGHKLTATLANSGQYNVRGKINFSNGAPDKIRIKHAVLSKR